MITRPPGFGEQAPWFKARSPVNPRFSFDTVAGRAVVMTFFASGADEVARRVLAGCHARRDIFDDRQASFFGVSIDPADELECRVPELLPGCHVFWDFDRQVSRLYGLSDDKGYRRATFVLDERLRVFAVLPMGDDGEAHVGQILRVLSALLATSTVNSPSFAPVLIIPRVFELPLCRRLMAYYDEGGDYESGFMREVDGKTVGLLDHEHKRRRDKDIVDEALRQACMARIHDRVAPEILRAFQFRATRIERHIVACYDAGDGGHFRAHRDNTTPGTAHRRFAVSVVLNSGEFEGGATAFP